MRIRDLLPISLKALLVNRGRTTLTMLGIIIGIASVILMVSVGQSAEAYLLDQVASFGSDLITVSNGKGTDTSSGPPSATIKQSLTARDYEKLKGLSWPTAVDAAAIANDLVSYGGQDELTQVSGAAPDELVVYSESVAQGTYFTDDDLGAHSRVVVLGSKIATELFGEENPIGKTVKIAKQPFKVIGVLAPAGTKYFSDVDAGVVMPFTTELDLYNKKYLDYIAVKAGSVKPDVAQDLVRVALREDHNIDNPTNDLSKDDFNVSTEADAQKSVGTIGTILQILLASIASISLLVAGVGIMNIMYVTVTERTREVGLRKAIGAKSFDVLGQFLAEAVMLTAVAGTIGIILGVSFAWIAIHIISYFSGGWTFVMPWAAAIISFVVSAAIGIIFGFFPARRASTMNAIEALRYE
ncbi:MAG: ABC transporter permease [Patescibacteria group bacterium]